MARAVRRYAAAEAASGAEGRDAAGRARPAGPDGRFTVDTSGSGDIVVTVLAGGFAPGVEHVSDPSKTLDITLAPAGLLETVTVTPTRSEQRLGDTPASQNIVTSKQIEESPA